MYRVIFIVNLLCAVYYYSYTLLSCNKNSKLCPNMYIDIYLITLIVWMSVWFDAQSACNIISCNVLSTNIIVTIWYIDNTKINWYGVVIDVGFIICMVVDSSFTLTY